MPKYFSDCVCMCVCRVHLSFRIVRSSSPYIHSHARAYTQVNCIPQPLSLDFEKVKRTLFWQSAPNYKYPGILTTTNAHIYSNTHGVPNFFVSFSSLYGLYIHLRRELFQFYFRFGLGVWVAFIFFFVLMSWECLFVYNVFQVLIHCD